MSAFVDWLRPQRRPSLSARLDLIVQSIQQVNIKLQAIPAISARLERMEKKMATLDTLASDLTQNTSVVQSAATLLGTLAQEVRDLKGSQTDPGTAAKIDALAAGLEANNAALSAAVAANTPAATPSANAGTGTTGSDTSAGTGAGGTAPATGGDAAPPVSTGGDSGNVA